jgi:LysM repeat protein
MLYEVKEGDTLYSISRRYYIPVEELMQLNNMNSSHLSIGQQLKIKTEKPR